MNDDQRQLANAYLDDEVSVDERSRAEADPEVLAEVARLQAVREALRVSDRPDAARRDAAILAALEAFEIRPAATIATTPDLPVAPPASLDAKRRARWLGPLAAAAAAVVVIAGGVAILGGGGEDGDDAASVATPAAAELEAAASQPAVADTAAAAAVPDAAATEGTSAAADEAAPAAGEAAPVLRSPEDLAAFAAKASEPAVRTNADDAVGCALGDWVGAAVYEREGEALTVDVFVDDGEAVAADSVTCEVVARAQLP